MAIGDMNDPYGLKKWVGDTNVRLVNEGGDWIFKTV